MSELKSKIKIEFDSDIEKLNRQVEDLKKNTLSVAKIAKGVVFGGGSRDLLRSAIQGLQNLIEKNKDSDKSIGRVNEALKRMQDLGAKLGLIFLKFVAGPLTGLINGFESLSNAIFGVADTEGDLTTALKNQSELLNSGTLSVESRKALIDQMNVQYKEYLPNLISEGDSIEQIRQKTDAANVALQERIRLKNLEFLQTTLQEESIRLTENQLKLETQLFNARKKLNQVNQDIMNGQLVPSNILINATNNVTKLEEELNKVKTTLEETKKTSQAYGTNLIKTEKEVTKELEKQVDLYTELANLTNSVAGRLGSSIGKSLSDDDFVKARFELNQLILLKKQFEQETGDKRISDLSIESLRLAVLEAEILKTTVEEKLGGALTTVKNQLQTDFAKPLSTFTEQYNLSLLDSVEFTKEALDKIIAASSDGLLTIFETVGFSEDEANKAFKNIYNPAKSFIENIRALNEAGIKSPLFDQLLLSDQDVKKAELAFNQATAAAKKYGQDRGKQLEDLNNQIAEAEVAFNEARIKTNTDTNEALYQLIAERNKTSLEQLTLSEEDLLEERVRAGKKNLDLIDAQIVKQIDKNKKAGDLLTEAEIQVLGELKEQRKVILKQNADELENLNNELTKMLFDQFKLNFQKTGDELSTELDTININIRRANRVLEETYTDFNAKKLKETREFTQDELDILNQQVDNIQTLENDKYSKELELRVTTFKSFIENLDIESDEKVKLIKEFYNTELELAEDHVDNLTDINNKRPDSPDKVKVNTKALIQQGLTVAITLTNSFNSIYQAYTSLQDRLMQNAMDRLTEQISIIDTAIADSTSNLDRLESDLEGKRSGRREAVLRGIEIEKQRQRELNQEKIRLERELQQKEKEAAEARKAAAIAQAIINGALAITSIWSQAGTLGPIAGPIVAGIETAAIAVVTGFQIAEIEAQEFADGGLLKGPSHSQGGIPFTINGQGGFEAEGGEAIMSRRTVEAFGPQLNAMQKATGSKALFADGGTIPNFNAMSSALNQSQLRQFQMIAERPSYVLVTDINNMNAKQVKVTSITNI